MVNNRSKPTGSQKLPAFFRSVMWSYNIDKIFPEQAKKEIIVNTLNYGQWQHLEWIVKRFGKDQIREIIKEIPASEFRPPVLELAKILFKINSLPYALRSDKIRS